MDSVSTLHMTLQNFAIRDIASEYLARTYRLSKSLLHAEFRVSYRQQIARIKNFSINDVRAVELGAVLAAKVFNPELAILKRDECMVSGNIQIVDHHLILGISADPHPRLIENKRSPALNFNYLENKVLGRWLQ